MARMTLASSADLLNDTDALEQKMRWQEFQIENAWDYIEGEWMPGKPIYREPLGTLYGEQHVRPMFEIYDPWFDPEEERETSALTVECHEDCCPPEPGYDLEVREMRCQDCMVNWMGSETCWICGETRELECFATWEMSSPAARWYANEKARDMGVEVIPRTMGEMVRAHAESGSSDDLYRLMVGVPRRSGRYPWRSVQDFDGETHLHVDPVSTPADWERYTGRLVSTPRRHGRTAMFERQMAVYASLSNLGDNNVPVVQDYDVEDVIATNAMYTRLAEQRPNPLPETELEVESGD